jgi:hypothetical protein
MHEAQVSYEDLSSHAWVIGTPGSHRRLRFEKSMPIRISNR